MPFGPEALPALVVFALVTSITPGPNTMMLLASGVNFGFRRTLPHMLGVALGFAAMLTVVGLGLGAAITASPVLHGVLRVASTAYVLWLAWKLASSGSFGSERDAARPMTFVEAALFQWINPKAWAIAVAAAAVHVRPDAFLASVALIALVFALVGLPSNGCWAGFGVALRGFLSVPARLRAFNIVMAVLLAASVLPFAGSAP
jgi:threonine/homoserine/homoserine lactone efflux protein